MDESYNLINLMNLIVMEEYPICFQRNNPKINKINNKINHTKLRDVDYL